VADTEVILRPGEMGNLRAGSFLLDSSIF